MECYDEGFWFNWVAAPNIATTLAGWHNSVLNAEGKEIWRLVPAAVCWSVWSKRNNRICESAAEPSFQVYRKAKKLLLFGARRCKGCGNNQIGGLLRDWQAAIGLL